MEWNKSQLEAICADDPRILVSAAAGSGKTAVLTERLVRRVTSGDDPLELSRALVVTFTRTAAAELKDRIGAALNDHIASNPGDRHAIRQLSLLPQARISTIHSFCFDLIRSNFNRLGLPASVRILDPTEASLLSREIMEDIVNRLYDGQVPDCTISDFDAFTDNFNDLVQESPVDRFLWVYKTVRAFPDGIDFIADSARMYRDGNHKDDVFHAIRTRLNSLLDRYISIYASAVNYFGNNPPYDQKYLPVFEAEADNLRRLRESPDDTALSRLAQALSEFGGGRLGSVKANLKTPEAEYYCSVRDEFKKTANKFLKDFLGFDAESVGFLAERSAAVIGDLYSLIACFDRCFTAEKLRRGTIDYTDLEHMAYQLLSDDEFADEVSARFDEIYVDEYQDVNELQDAIFSRLGKNARLFMVGDVKQSIFGFRGAVPSLFTAYRVDDRVRTIYLSENYRSRKPVIDFCNALFTRLFGSSGSPVPYNEGDLLICGNPGQPGENAGVEIILTDTSAQKEMSDAEITARKIEELIDEGTPPEDIVVLLRSMKNNSELYEEALNRHGVPCFNTSGCEYFENPEVLLALCLLNCVDNPTRDIYLAGALRSPLYGVTLDELTSIRRTLTEGSLYDALVAYTEETGFPKGKVFLECNNRYREYARSNPVDKIIWFIFKESRLLSFAGEGGSDTSRLRHANLMLLYEYARKYEGGSFKGLYDFIRYINGIIESGQKLDNARAASEASGVVKIMSIHLSKGLQFPVCFVCNTTSEFNRQDVSRRMLIRREDGISLRPDNGTGAGYYETPERLLMQANIVDSSTDEEMRILYVACTRAVRRLFITATSSNMSELNEKCTAAALYAPLPDAAANRRHPSSIDWILETAAVVPAGTVTTVLSAGTAVPPTDEISIESNASDETTIKPGICDEEVPTPNADSDNVIAERLREIFDFSYPFAASSSLPAKLSVSDLYPSVLDTDSTVLVPPESALRLPSFDHSSPTAADRGTATHVFLQFCDYSQISLHGTEAELERLVRSKFMTASDAALVNIGWLDRFFASDLFGEICRSPDVRRELRFNVRLDADGFTEDTERKLLLKGEKILVQGVIDCFYTCPDGSITIVDYKTDRKKPEWDDEEFSRILRERHGEQLKYYRAACEKITCGKVGRVCIYALSCGMTVDFPF